MSAGYADMAEAARMYLALTKEELAARCVQKDAAQRILLAKLEDAERQVILLKRSVAIGRNRI